jgi:hypothetical protein
MAPVACSRCSRRWRGSGKEGREDGLLAAPFPPFAHYRYYISLRSDSLIAGPGRPELAEPSRVVFADAERHYREVFAPRTLRGSTYSIAEMHIENHLLPDRKDTPVEHITIDSVNEWIWKKRDQDLSWVTIKNILRTMQRGRLRRSKEQKFSSGSVPLPSGFASEWYWLFLEVPVCTQRVRVSCRAQRRNP